MPIYNPGAGPDSVVLKVNGRDLRIFTKYTIRKSILTQPAQFTLGFGWGEMVSDSSSSERRRAQAKDLIELVPRYSPFELYVNDCLQQTGHTDGFGASGLATEIDVFGRDNLALLHDAFLLEDLAFENETYKSLTEKVLQKLNINERVSASDQANLKLTMGVGIDHYENPQTIDQIEEISQQPGNKIVRRAITAKIAETHYQFLMRQYRRAGLYLWAAGDGSFVLSEPNWNQAPSYRLIRQRGQIRNAVNILRHNHRDDITHRFTSAHVYGRSPGRKGGRAKAIGEFIDPELFNEVFHGDFKPISFRDVNVATRAQAEFYARRKLAEFNRAAWKLEYVVSGHTAPNILSGLTSTWCPNTMVEVQDDELGIKGNFYIEEVTFSAPPCETTLSLMNPIHMIFASDDEEQF